jgi:pimeloyl-ACP methyl ester carboxylesterase
MASGLLDSWLDAGAATLEGLGKCWATTFQRGPVALDLPRWLAVTAERRAPSWTTPHEVVFEGPLARLRDFSVSKRPAHVARYREFEHWFKHTQDVPGAFYLWIVRRLFRDNALIAGSLEVRGRKVDLGRIGMPLNLLAGATDHITPPDQVFALATHASTPGELVTRHTSTGGHLGLFMGHEALREHWPRVLSEVVRHSRASAPPRRGSHR